MGTARRAPTMDYFDDAVKMIGHDYIFAQCNFRTYCRRFYPFIDYELPVFIQRQGIKLDSPKQAVSVVSAYRYEIRSSLSVIEFFQPD